MKTTKSKNKKNSDKKTIKIWGFKMSKDNLLALIIFSVFGITFLGWTLYKDYEFKYGYNINVNAEIIDIYWKKAGGRAKFSYPVFKCKYFHNDKEYIRIISFPEEQWDNMHIGDCVELTVNLDNEKIYKWNEGKGTFNCNHP